ncbi:hypothetical protein AVEN_197427-1 [Araneus ventricosus]|uniref:Uncharacterized protein n=1 Tax=Araneus ventricosus TaxID=182803 RepID=A0A4Y2ICP2_ARAVE|nr:hypothetical protein AVEN_197427-1 [Araneus ventricosus]
MERENYNQSNCSTAVNTCKISLRSLITLNLLLLTSKEQEFIIALYSNTQKEESSLNKMRYDCFNQQVGQANSAILLSKLPPTTEAAHKHCRRTFHQVHTWQGKRLNPSSWRWKLVSKSLTPIYTIKGPTPAKIVSVITCGCTKGCGKNAKVSVLTKKLVQKEDEGDNDIIQVKQKQLHYYTLSMQK